MIDEDFVEENKDGVFVPFDYIRITDSPRAAILLAYMLDLAQKNGKEFQKEIEEMSLKTGMSANQVKKARDELVARGLIKMRIESQ